MIDVIDKLILSIKDSFLNKIAPQTAGLRDQGRVPCWSRGN